MSLITLRLSDPQEGRAPWIRATWPRTRLDQERVDLFAALYQEGGPDALPPITVVRGERGFILADGVHRVVAAWSLGLATLPAERLEPRTDLSPQTQAFLVALDRAAKGPLPLTFSERKAAALRLLRECPNLSQRQVARLVGVSQASVSRWASGDVADEDGGDSRESLPVPLLADTLARSWLRRMRSLEARKGLSDLLFGDQMPKRLAKAALDAFGDEASTRLERYANWFFQACAIVKGEV